MNNEDRIIEASTKGIIDDDTKSALLEYRKRLASSNVPVIYNLRHIRKIFQIRRNEQELFFGEKRSELYRAFTISKKSGGERLIEAPVERLKEIQRWIKDEIHVPFPDQPGNVAMCQLRRVTFALGRYALDAELIDGMGRGRREHYGEPEPCKECEPEGAV